MNILIIPHTGKRKVRGESNYILFEDMAHHFLERNDNVFFCVPEWTEPSDIHLQSDRLSIIRIPYVGSYYVDMSLIGEQIIRTFNRKISDELIDVVITSKPFLVPTLSVGLADIQRREVPVIYFEPGVADKFERLKKSAGGFNTSHFLTCAAYVTGYPIFLTQVEKDIAKQYVKNFVTSAMLSKFYYERSIVLPVGVPVDVLDRFKTDEKNELFTLFFGGRVNDVKRAEDIVKLYDMFYSSGRQVKIVICTSTPDVLAKRYIGKERFRNNKNIELHTGLSREEYLKIAAKAHVFVAWSRREGFPVGFWEQLYLGLVGVYVHENWVDAQIPQDYPFRFRNFNEAYSQLIDIYDNYGAAKTVVGPLAIQAKQFDKTVIYEEVRKRMVELSNLRETWRVTRGVRELALDSLATMENRAFTMEELLNKMQEKGVVFLADVKQRSQVYRYPTNYDLYRFLTERGFDYAYFEKGLGKHVFRRSDNGDRTTP
jgi:hypothetical protein